LLIVLITLLCSAKPGHHVIKESSLTRFCFGEGRWIFWHGLLYVPLFGMFAGLVLAWLSDADHAMSGLLLLVCSLGLLLLISLVNAVLWSTRLYDHLAMKIIAGPALVVVAWFALLALIFVYNQVLIDLAFGGAGIAGVLFILLFASAIGLLNLIAIHRFRQ
ncbi:MAG: hypothetical protein ACU843_10740, partial [Gammaproteobacteria bacterium]